MTDRTPLVASCLLFVALTVAAVAVCYRFFYRREPQPQSPAVPPPLPTAAPIEPGSTIPAPGTWTQAQSVPRPPEPGAPRAGRRNRWIITDEASARTAAREAMWASFFIALVTGVMALLAGAGVTVLTGVSPLSWVDAVIFAGLGLGIKDMRRVAAVGALVLYIIERITMARTVGFSPIMSVVMVACFMQGVRGTFAYHKYRQQSGQPAYAPAP